MAALCRPGCSNRFLDGGVRFTGYESVGYSMATEVSDPAIDP